jgi:hypothetical protein
MILLNTIVPSFSRQNYLHINSKLRTICKFTKIRELTNFSAKQPLTDI